jgi:hypothetical protein
MTTLARLARPALAAFAALSLSACGKPLLYVEVEIPDVQVTIPAQDFPSTVNPPPINLCPPEVVVPAGTTCLQQSVTYDLGKDFTDLTKDAVEYELRLTDLAISLTAASGIVDFGGVTEVRVGVQASASLPAVDLASYQRLASNPNPTSIAVRAQSNVDLGAYVQAGQVAIFTRMIFDQALPAFTADVKGDFYLRAQVDWGKKAGVF